MRKVTIAGFVIALMGCAGAYHPARIVVLQNPKTGQTVECRVDPWGSLDYKLQIDNCIAAYEKSGFKLVADSAAL